ncbi:MAG: response regulator transcription factor [Sulfurimicrobium sp.]|nr:response regulator transcription factor [Sulfurimicrobium sp.]
MEHGILIVDDNAMTRKLLRSTLRSANLYVVGEAGSGEAAIAMVEKLHPAIVCLDIFMPGMDGIETLKALKASYPRIVVLMVTGNPFPEKVKEALSAGANGLLVKPFTPAKVMAALRVAMRRHEQEPS